jgi:hypothetical protein
MTRPKMAKPKAPRPFGYEAMSAHTYDDVVADLGVPHLARTAAWRLLRGGPGVMDAVVRGLEHPEAAVRAGCCEILGHRWDERARTEVLRCLDDDDPRVRAMAEHALACKRCKGAAHGARRTD